MSIYAIGDIHRNIPTYEKICKNLHKVDENVITIQVGDVGIGFEGVEMPSLHANDYFIAGNHDDAEKCKLHPNCLGDYGVKEFDGKTVFYLRGAYSTDRDMRIPGISWWEYEELNYEQLCNAIKLYDESRPDIVITHDCPTIARTKMFGYRHSGRTVPALQNMFEIHQPPVWAFGHHHRQLHTSIYGTYFYCIGEMQNKKISP